jgi:hypothetical protein
MQPAEIGIVVDSRVRFPSLGRFAGDETNIVTQEIHEPIMAFDENPLLRRVELRAVTFGLRYSRTPGGATGDQSRGAFVNKAEFLLDQAPSRRVERSSVAAVSLRGA